MLWSGQTVSLLGDGVYTIALALETLRVDSRPTGLSFVLAARLVPTVLLLLVGGVVVDRVPRRLAMLASDTVRGASATALALLTGLGVITLPELVVLSLVFGVADAFFYPAATAIVPELLPEALLVQGSALSSASQTTAQSLIGPALGGVLVGTLGNAWGFGADAASFAVSAGCLLLMTSRLAPAMSSGRRQILAEVREGLGYCFRHPWLWATLLSAAVANFAAFSPLALLIPLLVRHVLHQGGVALGVVMACGGLGGMVGSVLIGRLGAPRRRITWMFLSWGAAGAGAVVLALSPDVWVAGAASFVIFGLLLYGNALWTPLVQNLVPRDLMGRVSSVDWLISLSLSPVGVLMAGGVSGVIGVRLTMLIGAGAGTLMAATLLIPGVRDPERGAGPFQRSRASGD